MWTSIRKLLPNVKERNINSVINQADNEEMFEMDAANYINDFFCTICTKLGTDIPLMEQPNCIEKTYKLKLAMILFGSRILMKRKS